MCQPVIAAVLRSGTLLFSVCLLACGGCAVPASYREPISTFQQASTIVIEGARVQYAQANIVERDAMIDTHADRRTHIDVATLDDPEIVLLTPDALAARMNALNAIAKHGQLLLALASSDAPERARSSAKSLDDAIHALSSSLGEAPSDEFKAKGEGFAAIAGEVVKLALDAEITAALDKSIIASEQYIQELIGLLKSDMAVLYERRRQALSAQRVRATDEYNDAVASQKAEAIDKAAARIKRTEDAWSQLPLLLGAGPGLDAMTQAHQDLVDYAKSPKTPQDFADLVDAIDAFADQARVIADAIKTIRAAKE